MEANLRVLVQTPGSWFLCQVPERIDRDASKDTSGD
jgi:hypothetical protein